MMRSAGKRWSVAGISVFAAAMTVSSPVSAQHDRGALSGQVVDAASHDVLDSVRVKVKGTTTRASTRDDGSFFLDKLLGDNVVLVISRPGYKTREVDVSVATTESKWTIALWKAR